MGVGEEPPADMEMCANQLHRDWMAKCERVSSFIRPHGERGLERAFAKMDELIDELSAGAGVAQVAVQVRVYRTSTY